MVLEIRGGKHPHEVALLVVTFILGLAGALFYSTVASTTVRALPAPFGQVLYIGVSFTAAVALVGVFQPGVLGALIERTGLWSLSAWSLVYAGVILANSGARGIMFGGFMTGYAVANFIRARQISKEIAVIQLTQHVEERP